MKQIKISKRSAELAQAIIQRVHALDQFDARTLAAELNSGAMNREWGLALWTARQVMNAAGRLYVPAKAAYLYRLATPKDRIRTARNMLHGARRKVGRAPVMLPRGEDVPPQLRRSFDKIADVLSRPIEMVAMGLEHANAMLALPDDTAKLLKASKT
jgi:hypothetical protein